jgi:hypothetical protein
MGAYTQLWGATVATPSQITAQVRIYALKYLFLCKPGLTVRFICAQYLVPFGKVGDAGPRAADVKLEAEVVAYIREQVTGY